MVKTVPERTYLVRAERDRYPAWKTGGPPADQLDIELTERCNNACIHCCINVPAGDTRVRSRELGTEEWKQILNQAAQLGVMTIRMTGGEPLLRDDFPDLYLYTRRLGMKVLLFTNACLITPAIAALLAEIPPLEEIEISVYGMKRESYEAVTRVAGSYDRFRGGLQCLLDRKIPFVVKGALLPPNKAETAEFAAWAAANSRMDAPPTAALLFDLRSRRDSAAKNRRIRGLRLSPEEALAVLAEHPDRYRREMAHFFDHFSAPPGDRLFPCGIGPGCVDAYGIFQPCMGLRDPGLTFDLKNGTLKTAIAFLLPRLSEMRATSPRYLARCARCFLRGMCEQCPAKSWAEHGTLDTPVEYLCRAAHAQARFLGLLGEEEQAWEVRDSPDRIRKLKRRTKKP
jgi:radical SAM protein with 4Fe4S-binding SPASM domain